MRPTSHVPDPLAGGSEGSVTVVAGPVLQSGGLQVSWWQLWVPWRVEDSARSVHHFLRDGKSELGEEIIGETGEGAPPTVALQK